MPYGFSSVSNYGQPSHIVRQYKLKILIPAAEIVDHQLGVESAVAVHPEQDGGGQQGQETDNAGVAFFCPFPAGRKRAVHGRV